ncbi:hypothetical protein E2C01_052636 [Portunus trituberculatus]|uniref:Uncharacterized protein n=1 Tax=Portunus trituberculatus TaxID=210409 RepID=A0A5B7GE90_PORTR|nr:hypothetical protein [Portunus trituberculatus]
MVIQKADCIQDPAKLTICGRGRVREPSAHPASRRSVHIRGEDSTPCLSVALNGFVNKVFLDSKNQQLIKDDVSVGHIKCNIEVNEGHHAAGGEVGVKLCTATLGAPAWQEAKQTWREFRLQLIKKTEK